MRCLANNVDNVGEAVRVLKEGGVIAHPADTCFGLAADLLNKKALEKLQRIKGRDAGKPMSIMLPPHLKPMLGQYAQLNEFAEMVCEELLPGPVTIILPKGPKIPDYFFPPVPTIGIRVPYDELTTDILMRFRGPLITTSANLSDQPVCCSCADVKKIFKGSKHQPDLLLEGNLQGLCLPSTVISLKNDKITILRKGPLGKEQIEAILSIES